MDNTSLESTFHWLSEDVLKFEVDDGFESKWKKNVTVDTRKMNVLLHGVYIVLMGTLGVNISS